MYIKCQGLWVFPGVLLAWGGFGEGMTLAMNEGKDHGWFQSWEDGSPGVIEQLQGLCIRGAGQRVPWQLGAGVAGKCWGNAPVCVEMRWPCPPARSPSVYGDGFESLKFIVPEQSLCKGFILTNSFVLLSETPWTSAVQCQEAWPDAWSSADHRPCLLWFLGWSDRVIMDSQLKFPQGPKASVQIVLITNLSTLQDFIETVFPEHFCIVTCV